jgi:DNA replication and repair protein RecF
LKDCIQTGEKFFHIAAEIQGIRHGLTFSSENMERSLFVGSERVKSVEFILNKSILHFSPDESHLFFQSQEVRRSILDRYISTIDSGHIDLLLKFNHLRSRKVQILFSNTQRKMPLLTLEGWVYKQFSSSISHARNQFLEQLSPHFEYFIKIFNAKLGATRLVYRTRKIPEDYLEKELQAERVLYGCQKDEIDIIENGREIRQFFSNGEKKAINLAFHFAFMQYLREKRELDCLVCLDDIESELDHRTLENINGIISEAHSQFFITSKRIENAGPTDILLKNGEWH